ncbi:hypothetical protein RRG08_060294 [Elysia crispata]|uniref:Uncharacterized protein n=1 Tax=Elysia crispata TaxID=231223 RepID=A0AAE1DBI4_9GAST|nr:hypothetical protein RRG08_060294 [Elysia crispata]
MVRLLTLCPTIPPLLGGDCHHHDGVITTNTITVVSFTTSTRPYCCVSQYCRLFVPSTVESRRTEDCEPCTETQRRAEWDLCGDAVKITELILDIEFRLLEIIIGGAPYSLITVAF